MILTSQKPLEAVLKKAQSQLDSIAKEEGSAQIRYRELTAERERIREQQTDRAQRLADLHSILTRQHEAVTQAEDYAALSQGTANEQRAILALKECRAQLATAQKEVTQHETNATKAEARETERLAAIEQESAACQRKILNCQQRRATIENGAQQAQREQVAGLMAGMSERLKAAAIDIDIKRKELTLTQLLLEDVRDDARNLMQEWPETRDGLELLMPLYEDSATRVLSSAIVLFGLLIDEGPQMQVDSAVLHKVSPWSSYAVELLSLEKPELWPIPTYRQPDIILERKGQLEQLLVLHRAEKQQQGGK